MRNLQDIICRLHVFVYTRSHVATPGGRGGAPNFAGMRAESLRADALPQRFWK
jgi:hypothetical protein